MELTAGAIHLAFERGINGALLLDAVLAAKALVDDHGGHVNAITAAHLDLRIREGLAQEGFDFMGLHWHGAHPCCGVLLPKCRVAMRGTQATLP